MPPSDVALLIGDVVRSRDTEDRRRLHDTLTAALASVNEDVPALDPLGITVGDEFQGAYARLGEALRARLLLRLTLSPGIDVRLGVGRGAVTVLDEVTRTQDGPGWWGAREAIDHVKDQARATGWERLRTAYRCTGLDPDLAAAVDAAVVCQDLVLGSLDRTEWTILRGIMQGRTQTEVAEQLGISRQAVHQRRKSAALPMLAHSLERLGDIS